MRGSASNPPRNSSAIDGLESQTIGAELLHDYSAASQREWLVTNGIGGYASGSLAGANTRRYHGLLVASLTPPTGRTVILSKLEETLTLSDGACELSANQYPGTIHPQGFRFLATFSPWPAPTFIFRPRPDVCLEKTAWMARGRNTTYVRYCLAESPSGLGLRLTPLVCWKDYHTEMRASDSFPRSLNIFTGETRLTLRGSADGPALKIIAPGAGWERADYWHYNLEHLREMDRGLDFREDLYCPGHFLLRLNPGQEVTLIASLEDVFDSPADSWQELLDHQKRLLKNASAEDGCDRALTLAADAFVIASNDPTTQRPNDPTTEDEHEHDSKTGHAIRSTIIAGYHWFCDWGRDTMISLPGLCITTGRHAEAREILLGFADHISQGMLPNRFPDRGETPEYNTADATLWYFQAIYSYARAFKDGDDLVRDLWPGLEQIVDWHLRGTRYGIGVDPADGLLRAGEPGVQLTWMDAKVGDWVVTPRTGKPVEINALWYNALRTMERHAARLGCDGSRYRGAAERARNGFRAEFVRPDGLGLYDVVAESGPDPAIRPNQIFAVSLPHSPLTAGQQRAVVDVVQAKLLTPIGLRTLAPDDPSYRGRYAGSPVERDGAYHQGSVWPWLLGPFVEAHLRVYKDRQATREMLTPLQDALTTFGTGQLFEVADGDPPHTPNGCIAQAWSVAEALRMWRATGPMG